ncbi:MAG: hypothetical protein WC602_04935 [archaeon]
MREFWPEIITRASWEGLQALSKELDFVLIGGWAAFMWTGKHKSRDIDIVVDHKALSYLKQKYILEKNPQLKKYEIKKGEFDIDIYVPFFSRLAIPPQDILQRHCRAVQGIRVAKPEALLVLKQAAFEDRKGSMKGKKDEIDIAAILIYADCNLKHYRALLEEYGKAGFAVELKKIVRNFSPRELEYLGMDFNAFKAWQKRKLEEIGKELGV